MPFPSFINVLSGAWKKIISKVLHFLLCHPLRRLPESSFWCGCEEAAASYLKHTLHSLLMFFYIFIIQVLTVIIVEDDMKLDPFDEYGSLWTVLLYFIRFTPLLALPQCLFNFFGLTLYNAFPTKVKLTYSPLQSPFVAIRIVTRGDYPDLVRQNALRNLRTCKDVGMENFVIEVITDKPIGLPLMPHMKEVVVPSSYESRTGAKFKARALQYCLEDGVNQLKDDDWIVHLDEETVVTANAMRGILNFIHEGRAQFGQGLITYANEVVVNWLTTLADTFRVADDMGKIRFQFRAFEKPLFGWKGSFVVTQVKAERDVSYDNGLNGSIAEDAYFGMKASQQGYKFGFIDGELWEKSPFTLWDFLQQRKRWMQGIYLVAHCPLISIKTKIFMCISIYSWLAVPLITVSGLLFAYFPVPCPVIINCALSFCMAVSSYMYVFGIMKSMNRMGICRLIIFLLLVPLIITFNCIIENLAVIWGYFGNKYNFYVVKKEALNLVLGGPEEIFILWLINAILLKLIKEFPVIVVTETEMQIY
ncbi:unnamed protein product [Darwinula stevensoni]|uniref:Glycosyltransferase 2-like domain-containing protein n=1 Tax=Darwinula stevensoni TaxID=69355 RepID=A0A7R9A5I7_9CRUS|nr:unnamed protein product [Darwinula stevensoni]CAG0892115.1 unnamed protein product [Darwinula stevensoni]